MADQGGNTSSNTTLMRDYRKGNWTVSETMILIEAKKMDEERRMKRIAGNDNEQGRSSSGTTTTTSTKPAELRWKWVEDYCWRKGCLRSQNQCNDKWDNLMRDYKKVRDYERRVAEKSGAGGEGVSTHEDQSYWEIEKNERKEKNLPTNMLPQIYEALVDVVERKSQRHFGGISGVSSVPSSSPSIGNQMVERPMSGGGVIHHPHHHLQQQRPLMASQPLLQPHHISASPITALPLPPAPAPVTVAAAEVAVAPPPVQAQPPPHALPYSRPILPTMCDSSDSDTSEHPNSPAKRRKTASDHQQQQHHQGPGTAPTTSASGRSSSSSSDQVVATAISKSASIIAEALQACEEREERRHRDLLSLHEKRLKIEESKTEVNRQGINGLVDAINKLANSIQALASDRHQSTSKPS